MSPHNPILQSPVNVFLVEAAVITLGFSTQTCIIENERESGKCWWGGWYLYLLFMIIASSTFKKNSFLSFFLFCRELNILYVCGCISWNLLKNNLRGLTKFGRKISSFNIQKSRIWNFGLKRKNNFNKKKSDLSLLVFCI